MRHLLTVVTTDLVAITRGRTLPVERLDQAGTRGVGWVPANIALTPFGTIAPNRFGSVGDLRLVGDPDARIRTSGTGRATPFDIMPGNLVELDGAPWSCCTRTALRDAVRALRAATGLSVIAAFEHEFRLFGDLPPAPAFSVAALRRVDPFAPTLFAALDEAGAEPESIIPEYGDDQFEVVCAPAAALAAADRAVAVREITRETAAALGHRASFSPKIGAIGSGVHVHLSLLDAGGRPVMHDPSRPGGLSEIAGRFCAGILRHMPALVALSAPSAISAERLRPHMWSASYTWLGDRDREASLRIAPVSVIGGGDPARQFNVEYRAADATGNPYLVLAGLIRAGTEGLTAPLPTPPIVAGDVSALDAARRAELGLRRLPHDLPTALSALAEDDDPRRWFGEPLIETFIAVKRAELAAVSDVTSDQLIDRYAAVY